MDKIILYTSFIVLILSSCNKGKKFPHDVFPSFSENKIEIPSHLEFFINNTPVTYDVNKADYKIITYIDSSSCTSCQLRLSVWNDLLNIWKSCSKFNISFCMIFNSRPNNEINRLICVHRFLHPISFDYDGVFISQNHFPKEEKYHTMLIGPDSLLVAIGDPTKNPKIKDIYNQILLNRVGDQNNYVLQHKSSYSTGLVRVGDTIEHSFNLSYLSSDTIIIKDIIPSDKHIKYSITSPIIIPNSDLALSISIPADSTVGSFARHLDVYFEDNIEPKRFTIHGYIINSIF